MNSRKERMLTLGLGIGLLALAASTPLLNTNRLNQTALQKGRRLNGLHLNTRQSNIITFNGTTVHATAQPDWIYLDTTQAILPNQKHGHLGLQGGQLTIQTPD